MCKTIATTIICVFALLLFTLTACNAQDPAPDQLYTLDDLLYIARERRLDIIANRPTHEQLLELTQGREPPAIDMLYDMWQLILNYSSNTVQSITAAEAIEDAELFLMSLRLIYGPYIYFGGDAVFAPVFDEIIAEIATHETMQPFLLEDILFRALNPVINDNHFVLGRNRLRQSANFFTSAEPFDRDERGFVHRTSGRVVAEIEGRDMYDVLRLSIDEDGDIFYSAAIYELGPAGLPRRNLNIVFDDGDSMALTLEQHRPAWRIYRPPSLEWIDGVPVVTVMSMGFPHEDGHNNESARAFLSFAEELRDEPVVFIDVRSSRGGNGNLGPHWLYEFFGNVIPYSYMRLATWDYQHIAMASPTYTVSPEHFIRFNMPSAFDANHSIMPYRLPDGLMPSNQLIIMLADRFTGSAGEGFVSLMLSLENTLIIGQNTTGVYRSCQSMHFMLPNSGIQIAFGQSLVVGGDELFIEGVGFASDIWVHGDALVAALTLIDINLNE